MRETPAMDQIVQMAPIRQAAATVFQSKFHPQEEQAKEEKDIAPSIHWDPTMNAPNLMNESKTQHQQQEEGIDMMPSYLPPSQSFVVAAQYENKDLYPSVSSSSWVPQGSNEPDVIGSSGGGDDDDNNNKKRIPKTTRILLNIHCWVVLFRANHRINIYIQRT